MSDVVLDASALLAVLQRERGAEAVAGRLTGAAISAVNLSEVAGRLVEAGVPDDACREALAGLALDVVPFDEEQAFEAARLRRETRRAGLSLGDRACLALALRRGVPALTADHAWKRVRCGVEIEVVRTRRR